VVRNAVFMRTVQHRILQTAELSYSEIMVCLLFCTIASQQLHHISDAINRGKSPHLDRSVFVE